MNAQDRKLIKGTLFSAFGYLMVLFGVFILHLGRSLRENVGIGLLMLGGIFVFIGLLKCQYLNVNDD